MDACFFPPFILKEYAWRKETLPHRQHHLAVSLDAKRHRLPQTIIKRYDEK